MQHTAYGQEPLNNLSAQSRTIAVIAICLFAMAGLISGFAVGAFVRPGQTQTGNKPPPGKTPIVAVQTQTPTPTPQQQHPINLGIPQIEHVSYTEVADGTTTYTLSAQVVAKGSGQPGSPVHASNITCKLWLVQHIPNGKMFNISTNDLKNVNNLQNPITGTVDNQPYAEIPGLTFFDTNSPQTHLCTSKGKGTWTYQVAPSVAPGVYDLVVLTDWSGIHYNWSWVQITVKNAK